MSKTNNDEFVNFYAYNIEPKIRCRSIQYDVMRKKVIDQQNTICIELADNRTRYCAIDDPRNDMEIINKYIEEFNEICKTFKIDNPFLYSYDPAKIVRFILYEHLKDLPIEELDEFEIKINDSAKGQINYDMEEKEEDDLVKYDINSNFAFLLRNTFPIIDKQGKFSTVKEVKEPYKYAFYKINIIDPKTLPFFWKYSGENITWITHYDRLLFEIFKTNYELVQEEDNCYSYEKENLRKIKFLENPVKKIYELKKKGNKVCKLVLSRFFGILTERSVQYNMRAKDENNSENQIVPVMDNLDPFAPIRYHNSTSSPPTANFY